MSWARIACFFKGHILEHTVMSGYMHMPVRCRRCDYTEAGIKYPPMPPIKPAPEPTAERVQIITAKAGDIIVVTFQAVLNNEQRARMRDMFTANLPEGVKLMVLEGGATLSHILAGHGSKT